MPEDPASLHLMLAATSMHTAPPTRIGSIGKNITLPRAVRLKVIVYVMAGLVPGAIVGLIASQFLHSITVPLTIVALGGATGGLAEAYKIQGVPVFRWLFRTARSTANHVAVNGDRHKVVVRKIADGPPAGDRNPVEIARTADLVAFATPQVGRIEPGARVYVGVCPLDKITFGQVTLLRSLVDVAPGSVDQFGYPVARLTDQGTGLLATVKPRRRAQPQRPS
jgi:hypothetical protein